MKNKNDLEMEWSGRRDSNPLLQPWQGWSYNLARQPINKAI